MITVSELKLMIKDLPDNYVVILQSDGEGNNYSPLKWIDSEDCIYEPENKWSGTVFDITEQEEYTEESVPCIVLYPIN